MQCAYLVFISVHVVTPEYNANLTIFAPVSVGYAFYPFDSNTLDLYCRRDGTIDGGPVSYTRGYIATGQAIVFNQSVPTRIVVANPFNLTDDGFTLEAFILVQNYSMNASLVSFSSGVAMNIKEGLLDFVLSEYGRFAARTTLMLNQWHHVAFVYNKTRPAASIYLDGKLDGQLAYLSPINTNSRNTTMIIGSLFEGIIDQLSIGLVVKTENQIQWDAAVTAYFPLEGENYGWLLDYGPNVLNASSGGTRPTPGLVRGALNFTAYGAFFQTPGITPLAFPGQPFTVAFWIHLNTASGVILTIANSVSCLLVLGIRSVDQRLVAYLPNSNSSVLGINLIGSKILSNQWTHVAFTWSKENLAQLYQGAALDVRNAEVTKVNQNDGEPMLVTVGMYRGKADCSGTDGFNMTQHFLGSLDEFYIFNQELTQDRIEGISKTTYT